MFAFPAAYIVVSLTPNHDCTSKPFTKTGVLEPGCYAQRAEKLASVNPRRFGMAGTAYSLMLSMHCRYGEAEETMRQVLRTYDR